MSFTKYQDILNKIFLDLKSRHESVRNSAADALKYKFEEISKELTGDTLSKINKEIYSKLGEMLKGLEIYEKIGALAALDRLTDGDTDGSYAKRTQISTCLRNALPNNETHVMFIAVKILAKLVVPGGSFTSELVELEVKRSFEWLQGDRNEVKRLAAILILKTLCQHAPTLMYGYVTQFLQLIWVALRDIKISIRENAAEALDSGLKIIFQRDSPMQFNWYSRTWEEMIKGLKFNSIESIHGSLLAIKELLTHTGDFMNDRFQDVAEILLRYKDHKDILIRKSVVLTFPSLAYYDPSEFSSLYLQKVFLYLMGQLQKEKERAIAFLSIGKISLAIGLRISPFVDSIVSRIKDALTVKIKGKTIVEPQIFQCISMLSISVGQNLAKHAQELVDLSLIHGLTPSLCQALNDLSKNVPFILPVVQARLLNLISLTMSGNPYISPGSTHRKTLSTAPAIKDLPNSETHGPEVITLALETLGTFDFSGHSLSDFVRECLIHYLEDPHSAIRKSAALTCCKLMGNDSIWESKSPHSIELINDVLNKLLMVGISDPDAHIRHTVLLNLSTTFDNFLSQANHLKSLFVTINDEYFPIRETSITLIGRLSKKNPTFVIPYVRKELIKLLTNLEYSQVNLIKKQSAILMGHLIRSLDSLIFPYIESILQTLLTKIRDPSLTVSCSVIKAIGELYRVGGKDLEKYTNTIFPIMVEAAQDSTSSIKRKNAIITLCYITSRTSYVIQPIIDYPELMPTLTNILSTEQNSEVRQETIRLMGILGALDPYVLSNSRTSLESAVGEPKPIESEVPDISQLLLGLNPSSEDYYPTIVVSSLLKIVKDPSLVNHHRLVIDAFMSLFKTLGIKCIQFLPYILPAYFNVIRSSPTGMHEFYLDQLCTLVNIVKYDIGAHLNEFISLIHDFWSSSTKVKLSLISLIEVICIALKDDFKVYHPDILPQMLHSLEFDTSDHYEVTVKILQTISVLGSTTQDYIHMIIPVIIQLLERDDVAVSVKITAIQTLARLCRSVQCSDLASSIVHPLSRILAIHHGELRAVTMDALIALACQLSLDYAVFVPLINQVMIRNRIQHLNYESLVSKILRNEPVTREFSGLNINSMDVARPDPILLDLVEMKKLPVNQVNLKKAWEAFQRSTKEDWLEWIRRLSLELLKESPSHALRACVEIASMYHPLARELFNIGFVSCWTELQDHYQDELVRSLENAMASPYIPHDILHLLLNLAEFMEHDDKTLPIDIRTLGLYSSRCHSYAKALRYKELEFISDPNPKIIEELISINNQLQQHDSAIGILTFSQKHQDLELQEGWYEKLGRWDQALIAYNQKIETEGDLPELVMGKMRCLHSLAKWEELDSLSQETWDTSSEQARKNIANMAIGASLGLRKWDSMEKYIQVMDQDVSETLLYKSISNIHKNKFDKAEKCIKQARIQLDPELTALIGDSYNQAYSLMIRVQIFSELEEIIQFKKYPTNERLKSNILQTWINRLNGCENDINIWHSVLSIRSLVIEPNQNLELWINFSNLCRKQGNLEMSKETLRMLSMSESCSKLEIFDNESPQIKYADLKYKWTTGDQPQVLDELKAFTKTLSEYLGLKEVCSMLPNPDGSTEFDLPETIEPNYLKLLARSYLKDAKWQLELQKQWKNENISTILHSYFMASKLDSNWYKAWHAWALANYEVANHYKLNNLKGSESVRILHVITAVQGFFKSIALSKRSSLQDALRLLTLWFEYGGNVEVNSAIVEGFNTVSIDTWLQVIPQLIARIHTPNNHIRRSIHQLLIEIGKSHPQALVYPVVVASKSASEPRQKAALSVMNHMKHHSSKLIEQALVVSQELIRVAILWHELWYEGLDEASKFYFAENNIEGMLNVLDPLHAMIEKGPETTSELSFNLSFGRDLQEAKQWCQNYRETKNIMFMHQAWDLYYQIFQKIKQMLPQVSNLELQYVSPKLLESSDLSLAIPGSYRSGEPVIKIQQFSSNLTVMTSKQRPRKLTILGANGVKYQYLLKGHEDLRQDERVMQLFGLVNTLLNMDPETSKRALNIERYPVIPLSPNSGLIGWVPNCDTLHTLIKEYRESRKIPIDVERQVMNQMTQGRQQYDSLCLLQKVEVFETALDNTTGQDLERVLWLKSRNSEAWLNRRTCYSRSLAAMSIVGYILGLGDRHPSNLMIQKNSGKVIHIDFGDCFEVAKDRDKFPETVPFRLTRMLTNAMEVSGIEGTYRVTCENVMRVLRDNKESLMAVLEAFVYDPLINWRLLTRPINKNSNDSTPNSLGADWNGNPFFSSSTKSDVDHHHRDLDTNIVEGDAPQPEILNERALTVIDRINKKLTGKDFDPVIVLDVPQQVDRLIEEAVSIENLCQLYIGWCSFW